MVLALTGRAHRHVRSRAEGEGVQRRLAA